MYMAKLAKQHAALAAMWGTAAGDAVLRCSLEAGASVYPVPLMQLIVGW
jgi:hypothetical protein